MKRSVLGMFIASIALLAQTALADHITPVGVIASGRMSDPENMIDESGMRVSGDRNDYRSWSSLPATKDTWYEANWFATTHSPGPWAILDLGSVCDLETISIWNCNPGSDGPYRRSVTKLDVYVRKDLDRNNTHENLAAFNPEGWTLLKSDLAIRMSHGFWNRRPIFLRRSPSNTALTIPPSSTTFFPTPPERRLKNTRLSISSSRWGSASIAFETPVTA